MKIVKSTNYSLSQAEIDAAVTLLNSVTEVYENLEPTITPARNEKVPGLSDVILTAMNALSDLLDFNEVNYNDDGEFAEWENYKEPFDCSSSDEDDWVDTDDYWYEDEDEDEGENKDDSEDFE